MLVRTNVKINFTADSTTFYEGDKVQVKTELVEARGRIDKIFFMSFKMAINEEQLIEIKYEDLVSIKKIDWSEKIK